MYLTKSERVWKKTETETMIRLVTSDKCGNLRLYVGGKFRSLLGRFDTPRSTQEYIATVWLGDLGAQYLAAEEAGEVIKARQIYRQMWRVEVAA